ncbi:hypothetical protein [Mesorhizobium sp. M0239]|uniref:hypothetical protein n=1 Tax=Mesorhizobium sp. M0239 TaxID=2956924 RepID=UPI0033391B71
MWTEITFGKHSGKTLPQLLLTDPDYFFWAMEEGGVFKGSLATQAASLLSKARRVKIPKANPDDWSVEYVCAPDGKFARFEIVEEDRPRHVGSSLTARSATLDFSFVRGTNRYDKSGYKLFVRNFKYYYFGSSDKRLTKKICEEFFDSSSNFT